MGQAVSPGPAPDPVPETPLDAVLAQLAELRDQLVLLEASHQHDQERIDKLAAALAHKKAETYEPVAAPRWWQASSSERDDAIARLRAWTDTVFRPGYGHLAAKVGNCWDQHDLCLYVLDWLSEQWAVIYTPAGRDTGMLWTQAEWYSRFLQPAVALLEAETAGCDHLPRETAPARGDPWAGTP
jgi:hypothetical protein